MNKRIETLTAFEFFPKKAQLNDVILIGIEIDNPENIGSLIRIGANIGCKKVLFPTQKNYNLKKIRRTATNAFENIDWQICELESWEMLIPDDYQIIAVETGKGAMDIFETKLPKKIAIVVGNESYGLKDRDIKKCNSRVYIPSPGIVKSLNVNQAAAVSLFEWFRQNYKSD